MSDDDFGLNDIKGPDYSGPQLSVWETALGAACIVGLVWIFAWVVGVLQ